MQWAEMGGRDTAKSGAGLNDWSELGRVVRRAAMAAVALHFVELAGEKGLPLRDDDVEPREATVR